MSEVRLQVKHVSKNFGITKALKDVSFNINKGEVHALIGENGSGKSTMTNMLTGIYTLESGQFILDGKEVHPKNQVEANEEGISIIVQELGTLSGLTVAENIFLGHEDQFVHLGIKNTAAMNKKANELLQSYGFDKIKAGDMIDDYNFEDRKLVEIVKATYFNPKIVVVDETTTALSQEGREELYKQMNRVRDNGNTVIFISHDLPEILDKSDTITILRDGVYIDTVKSADVNEDDLKKLMVGREVADNLYRADDAPDYQPEVVLRAEGLNAINVYSVTIELHKGEILGIGGLAECGMHELGKVLFGIEKPDSGTVTVGGKTITSPREAIRLGVGYLSKNRDTEAIILNASIQDNICLPSLPKLTKHGFINPKREKALAAKWTDALAIKMRSSDQHCRELSGGNKQKVVLAKWMGNDSQILIMDCPTRGIDIGVKEAIYKLMQQFKKEGRSMIMISEELPELIGMSDRILIMKNHEIVQEIPRSAQIDENQLVSSMI